MRYLLDTVAVVRHFSEFGRIGREASYILNTIEERDDLFTVSVVSLMEIMYLAEKNRIPINLRETLRALESSTKYMIVNLNTVILKVAETVSFPELHDRLILATAKWLAVPVISSDRAFDGVSGIDVIWD